MVAIKYVSCISYGTEASRAIKYSSSPPHCNEITISGISMLYINPWQYRTTLPVRQHPDVHESARLGLRGKRKRERIYVILVCQYPCWQAKPQPYLKWIYMNDAIGNLIVIERWYNCEIKTTRLLIPPDSVCVQGVVWVVISRYCRFSQLSHFCACPMSMYTVCVHFGFWRYNFAPVGI